jgi:hypothetical protein
MVNRSPALALQCKQYVTVPRTCKYYFHSFLSDIWAGLRDDDAARLAKNDWEPHIEGLAPNARPFLDSPERW